ncbi:unnamed protein product [Moneuplotes crassus]|uniref:Uncharacterized protein n=1 Tax=Euplotes crassus TaxID=5936 RepID=A0AAD1XA94_EUPCR|nr:unnamed protein product [Moneuplotes crassus]
MFSVSSKALLKQNGSELGCTLLRNKCGEASPNIGLEASAFVKYSCGQTSYEKAIKIRSGNGPDDSNSETKLSNEVEECKQNQFPRDTSDCRSVKLQKGKLCLRRDVVYKNLFRAIRATLWDDFLKVMPEEKYSRGKKGCPIFQERIIEFYENHTNFKQVATRIFDESVGGEVAFIEIMASFMTSTIFLATKSEQSKKIAKQIKLILKNYKPNIFKLLLKFERLRLFFQVLEESGISLQIIHKKHACLVEIDKRKIIEARYTAAIKTIINYGTDHELLPGCTNFDQIKPSL